MIGGKQAKNALQGIVFVLKYGNRFLKIKAHRSLKGESTYMVVDLYLKALPLI